MKSLAERHADRAQRKADNAEFSTQGDFKGGVGRAANLIHETNAALAALTEDQRNALREEFDKNGDGFADALDDIYDATGNLKAAGIGVINPLVVPAEAQDGNGGIAEGWGKLPDPSVTADQGNQNGAALAAQTGETKPSGRGKAASTKPDDADAK